MLELTGAESWSGAFTRFKRNPELRDISSCCCGAARYAEICESHTPKEVAREVDWLDPTVSPRNADWVGKAIESFFMIFMNREDWYEKGQY